MQELKATIRQETGKKVKTLRQKGILPAVLYGTSIPSPQLISIPYKEFEKTYKQAGESTLVTLIVDGTNYNVLIHDIEHDSLRGIPVHADFYAVRMDKVLHAKVPLEFFGESAAVKNEGGIFIKVVQELEVEALPQDLPHTLPVDISSLLSLESHLVVKDISVPRGVKILSDAQEVIAVVERPRSEEELASLKETPATTTPEEVKTEREVKREKETQIIAEQESSEVSK